MTKHTKRMATATFDRIWHLIWTRPAFTPRKIRMGSITINDARRSNLILHTRHTSYSHGVSS